MPNADDGERRYVQGNSIATYVAVSLCDSAIPIQCQPASAYTSMDSVKLQVRAALKRRSSKAKGLALAMLVFVIFTATFGPLSPLVSTLIALTSVLAILSWLMARHYGRLIPEWRTRILLHDEARNARFPSELVQWLHSALLVHSEICLMRCDLVARGSKRPLASLVWAGYGEEVDGTWFLVLQLVPN
jgi:hypothetical protein